MSELYLKFPHVKFIIVAVNQLWGGMENAEGKTCIDPVIHLSTVWTKKSQQRE